MSHASAIVLAVDAQTIELTAGDRVLARALHGRGVEVRPVVWGTPCAASDSIVIRSTWDYVERPDEFRSWLDDLDAAGNTVVNPTSLLRWNMHKGYLQELAARGVAVVPTEMLRSGSEATLSDVMTAQGWTQVVVKPAIGASARQTVRVGRSDFEGAEALVRRLLEAEDVLVQPFLPSIESDGEVSVVAIGGAITHAIAKRPASGEWRVQSEYGGSVDRVPVTEQHERAAAAVLAALDQVPAYARVDLVLIEGEPHLMELELIEPELFLESAPEAADRFADLLVSG